MIRKWSLIVNAAISENGRHCVTGGRNIAPIGPRPRLRPKPFSTLFATNPSTLFWSHDDQPHD